MVFKTVTLDCEVVVVTEMFEVDFRWKDYQNQTMGEGGGITESRD